MTSSLKPGNYNIAIAQAATWRLVLTWKQDDTPVNLTGCSAEFVVDEIVTIPVAPYKRLERALTLTDGDAITLGDTAGTITFELDATATGALDWDDAVYDLYITFPSTDVVRLLEGHVLLHRRLGD